MRVWLQGLFLLLLSGLALNALAACPPPVREAPTVARPPSGIDIFYKKYIDADGIPILASEKVCDRSLQIAYAIVSEMLSIRHDIRKNLLRKRTRVAIFALNEKMTDLPEDRDLKGVYTDSSRTRSFDDTCGGGGERERPTAVCERNLLGIDDPYYGRMSVLIHEFGHTIQDSGLDRETRGAIQIAYAGALAANLFPRKDGKTSYMMSNVHEFFAEGSGIWFNAADPKNPANSPNEKGREFLKTYAPELYQILAGIYRGGGKSRQIVISANE